MLLRPSGQGYMSPFVPKLWDPQGQELSWYPLHMGQCWQEQGSVLHGKR